jgi:hypothetical protein
MSGIGIAVGCLCSPSLMLSLNSRFSGHPGGRASSPVGVRDEQEQKQRSPCHRGDTQVQTESPSGTSVGCALMRESR